MHERDSHDTDSHSLKLELEKTKRALKLAEEEYTHLTQIAAKIVRNVCPLHFLFVKLSGKRIPVLWGIC